MRIIINGDIKEYYVQTLCLLFFPGSKFSKKDNENIETHFIYVDAKTVDENAEVTVKFKINDTEIEKTYVEKIENKTTQTALRIACGKAFLACGKQYTGKVPQWGILTGVRPSKLALNFLYSGKNKTEVKSLLNKEYFVNHKKASLVTDIAFTERKIISKLPDKTCSMYISIPFCPSRCKYCSFVSFANDKVLSMIDDYLKILIYEIDKTFEIINKKGLNVQTIYVGGGTPTTLNEKQLKLLMDCINKNFDVKTLEEYTVEAGRPDTITEGKLDVLSSNNVTRISINPQTLNSEVLEYVGRKHTVEDFYNAYNIARKSNIKDINTDLIAGLPYDGFNSFLETMDSIITLNPTNVTVHTLCIKNAAEFALYRDKINSPNNESSKCVDYSQISLKNAGYIPYYIYRQKNTIENLENVGFCKPGHEGKYNIYMMEEIHSIFGCGAGAVSKFVNKDRNNIVRMFDYKYPFEYISDVDHNKINDKINKFDELYKIDNRE